MRFSEICKNKDVTISFELFPPKTPEGEIKLFEQTIPELLKLEPAFLTCTYGAGGSTREKTLDIVSRIVREVHYEAASHLTCVGASRADLIGYLEQAKSNGIDNIVALRGDPPKGDDSFRPHPDGFQHAVELVAFLKQLGKFDIMVAGYPEGHPECPDKYLDWERCAAKVEAGADAIITQLFYNLNDFYAFEDFLVNKRGVRVPIMPGILPILSLEQIQRFCTICGSKLPEQLIRRLASYGDDKQASRQYGVELATEMIAELIRRGVPGIHFYTLNRSDSTSEIIHNLGLMANRLQ